MLLCAVVGGGDTMSFPSSTSKRRLVSGSSKSVSTVYGGRQMESPDSSIPVSTVAATIAHLLVAQYDAADATGRCGGNPLGVQGLWTTAVRERPASRSDAGRSTVG